MLTRSVILIAVFVAGFSFSFPFMIGDSPGRGTILTSPPPNNNGDRGSGRGTVISKPPPINPNGHRSNVYSDPLPPPEFR